MQCVVSIASGTQCRAHSYSKRGLLIGEENSLCTAVAPIAYPCACVFVSLCEVGSRERLCACLCLCIFEWGNFGACTQSVMEIEPCVHLLGIAQAPLTSS